jgi:hypothetical protein
MMNSTRWLFLIFLCLLLSTTSIAATSPVEALTPQQYEARMQAIQAAISTLLLEEDEHQLFLPVVVR